MIPTDDSDSHRWQMIVMDDTAQPTSSDCWPLRIAVASDIDVGLIHT